MGFVNERSQVLGESQTIDRERNAVLKTGAEEPLLIGPREPESVAFTMTWKGEKIQFGTRYKIDLYEADGSKAKITWHILKCVYPEHLKNYKPEIINLVVDAMKVYGVDYGAREGTEVEIKIAPGLGNLQLEPLHEMPQSPELSKNIH